MQEATKLVQLGCFSEMPAACPHTPGTTPTVLVKKSHKPLLAFFHEVERCSELAFGLKRAAPNLFRTEGMQKTGNGWVFRRDKASIVGTDDRESPNCQSRRTPPSGAGVQAAEP